MKKTSHYSWASHYPRRKGVKFGPHPTPLAIRFWDKVNKNGPIPVHKPTLGKCWVWTGALDTGGYGRLLGEGGRSGHPILAHYFLWTKKHGQVPKGKELDHLCRNRACVRDSHVEPVTRQINLLRGIGFVAKQAAQTSCIHGHPFTETNTYHWHGHRGCKTCRRRYSTESSRRHRAKN